MTNLRTCTLSSFALALGICAATPPATAQPAPPATPHVTELEGMDFDTLIACSMVYARVSELYREKAAGAKTPAERESFQAKAVEFDQATMAYSAASFHMLGYQSDDVEQLYGYAAQQQDAVMQELNRQSEASPGGDLDLISQWMGYCDSIGQNVTYALELREQRGW